MIRIALDAMGGEGAPGAPVEAALAALEDDPDLSILLVGAPDRIRSVLGGEAAAAGRVRIVPASERVDMDEAPARAVRRKRDSSIAVAVRLHASGEADAVVSAGSTGATVAASMLELEPIDGVDRPAVAALLPTAAEPVLLLDVGADVSARARHLHQFARLGTVYLRDLRGPERPGVGLLNVGEEAGKGDRELVEAHRRLREDPELAFVGNVEGDAIVEGRCDVVVCSGFTGNVLLKFYESVAGFVARLVAEATGEDRPSGLDEVLRLLDYTEHGGAPLLGVAGLPVICHGSSPPRAIRNALAGAARTARAGTVRHLVRGLADG